jgi:hypothetical protein
MSDQVVKYLVSNTEHVTSVTEKTLIEEFDHGSD